MLEDNPPLRHAIQSIADGNSVLFTGAGFSIGATSLLGEVPSAGSLCTEICRRLERGFNENLQQISFDFEMRFGLEELKELIKRSFTVTEALDHQKLICNMPWRRIYTTNYDNLIEFSLRSEGANPAEVSNLNPALFRYSKTRTIHLNGFVDHIRDEEDARSLKISFTSYDTDLPQIFSDALQNDFGAAENIFFIGFSLRDIDVRRILSMHAARENVFFITASDLSNDDRSYLEPYGVVASIGSDKFAMLVKDFYIPRTNYDETHYPDNFSKVTVSEETHDYSLPEIERYFVYKPLTPNMFSGSYDFILRRQIADDIMQSVDVGEKSILIHANSANGKTTIVNELIWRISIRNNINIFRYDSTDRLTQNDIRFFSRFKNNSCVIFDSEIIVPNVVSQFRAEFPEILVIYSVRSVHLQLRRAGAWMGFEHFAQFDANTMTPNDVSGLITILDNYGLWGRDVRGTDVSKRDFVNIQCNRQISLILLSLFDNETIRRHIDETIDYCLEFDQVVRDIFVMSLFLSFIGAKPEKIVLGHLMGMQGLSQAFERIRADPTLREIFTVDGPSPYEFSPLFSEYVLKKISRKAAVLSIFVNAARRSEFITTPIIASIKKELTRYGTLRKIIGDGDFANEALIDYLTKMSRLANMKNNHHFWLQFSIASTYSSFFQLAERHFGTAYRICEVQRKDRTSIDDHFAKFLLHSRTEKPKEYDDFTDTFKTSFDIARRYLIERKNAYFPLQILARFADFFRVNAGRFSHDEARSIAGYLQSALEIVQKLPRSSDFETSLWLSRAETSLQESHSMLEGRFSTL
tara:strand:- start:353 stop:2776 length:2424 start_codon:yes stop_codon:yes gene_type:complete